MSITKEQLQNEFEILWKRWPNKDSRKKSCQIYHNTIKTYKDIMDITQALDNYLSMLKVESWRKCKSGSTWFNSWQDWTNYKPEQRSQEIINNSERVKPLTEAEREQVRYSFSVDCQRDIRLKLSKAWHKAESLRKLNYAPACMW
jgi:tRNA A37 N6-isopentenylltransferase MiaA